MATRSESGLPSPSSSLPAKRDFYLAEYAALRDEILKRTEIQHQLVSLALLASATFLTFGSATEKLGYPLLGLFLAAAWMHSDCQISRMGKYIRERLEAPVLGGAAGWEHFYQSAPRVSIFWRVKFGSLEHFASRGIFIGTQLITVAVALLTAEFGRTDRVLLLLDAVVILFTLFLLRRPDLGLERAVGKPVESAL